MATMEHREFGALRIRQIIHPRICDAESGELLSLPPGTPVFHRTWVLVTAEGRPLPAGIIILPGCLR